MRERRTTIGLAAVAAMASLLLSCGNQKNLAVSSPSGNITVTLGTGADGALYYTVRQGDTQVVDSSRVALHCQGFTLGKTPQVKGVSRTSADETWETVWGEEREIRNNYNEMRVELEEPGDTARRYAMVFRVFDDGIGFRYEVPEQASLDSITILDEETEFALADDGVAWSIPWGRAYYEALYKPSLVSHLDTVCSPVTVKMTDSLYVAIHEANLTDYASMNLHPVKKGKGTTLKSYLTPWSTGEKVFAKAPMQSPWRTMIITKTPGELLLSRVMLNLNEPCAIETTDWIEPQRYIGIWWGMHRKDYTWASGEKHGATTENTKRYMDFAAANGFGGVLVEGWNIGWDGDWTAEGDKFSFTESYPDFDIDEITRYGKEKGVRLIGHNETGGAAQNYENQLDSAFALYERLGINSVKTGYVNNLLDKKELHGSQYGVRHYRKVIETAARHHIMIDNHEPVMPTGLQRTYPNLMTQEGVRGCEYDAWSPDGGNPPEHTVTIPFTRCLAGPVDYTPGIFNYDNPVPPYTKPNCTIAKQLALSVVLFSPLQMAADMIENYENRPEFAFITSCPTTWEKTVVPEARIGEYLTVARKDRNGDDWFIGAVTNANSRQSKVKLDFLDPDAKYVAKIYADGEGADFKANPYPVAISEVPVTNESVLPISLAAGGGAAVHIHKL